MKTKQLAKLFHLSDNTIRNYHGNGYLNPVVNLHNEREFTLDDFRILQIITRYRDFGISFKEIEEILEHGNYEIISAKLENVRENLYKELHEMQIRVQYLDYAVDNLNVARYLVDRISFEYAPCIRYFDAGSTEDFQDEGYIFTHMNILQEWSKYAGCVNDLELYKTENILKGDLGSCRFCTSMLDKFAQNTESEIIRKANILPECTCLVTVVNAKGDPEKILKAMQELLQYAEREHIKPMENMPIAKKLILAGGDEEYYKLYLPLGKFAS